MPSAEGWIPGSALEDTLYLPDGSHAPGNAALVRAARDLGAGQPD